MEESLYIVLVLMVKILELYNVFAVLQISSCEEYFTSSGAFAKARNTKYEKSGWKNLKLDLHATPN